MEKDRSDDDCESMDLCAKCNTEIGSTDKALLCDMYENWFCNKKGFKFKKKNLIMLELETPKKMMVWCGSVSIAELVSLVLIKSLLD